MHSTDLFSSLKVQYIFVYKTLQTVIIARFLPVAEEFPVAVHFFYLATLPSKPVLSYWEPYLKKSGNFSSLNK